MSRGVTPRSARTARKSDDEEVEELRDMLSARDSGLSVGVYSRYLNAESNKELARGMQYEKEQRAWEKEQQDAERREHLRIRRERTRETQERTRQARRELAERYREHGKKIRMENEKIKQELEEVRQEMIEEVKVRVQEAAMRDKIMDAAEEAKMAQKRQANMKEREQAKELVVARQKADEEKAKAKVQSVRDSLKLGTPGDHILSKGKTGCSGPATSSSSFRRAGAHDRVQDAQVRAMHERIENEKRLDEERRSDRLALARSASAAARVNGPKLRESMAMQKRSEASKVHPRVVLPIKEAAKLEMFEQKKQKAEAVYRRRYVSAQAAAAFESSDVRKLYSMDDQAEEEIARANDALRRRIAGAQTRTDDDISDEKAGMMREVLAEEEKRKDAEREAQIKKENAELKKRLSQVVSKTDDDIRDEVEWEERALRRSQTDLRRQAEEARIESENAALGERLRRTVAVTDTDISDEAAGAARGQMAHALEERRRDEAEHLDAENAAYFERLANVEAEVDDDIMDGEEAGAMRVELARQARERKAAGLLPPTAGW